MKITPEVMKALNRAVEHHGNVSQFAKKVGISHSTVLFWQSGRTSNINGGVWVRKLRPALLPFMEDAQLNGASPLREEAICEKASMQILAGIRLLVKLEIEKMRRTMEDGGERAQGDATMA